LSEIPGIGEKTAEKILAAARGEGEQAEEAAGATEEQSGEE
jgi:Holliday junction resolvasome RuvABC DNA-binding subunit